MGILLEAIQTLNEKEVFNEDLKGWAKNNFRNAFGKEIPDKEFFKRVVELAKLDPTFKFEEGESAEDLLKKLQPSYLQWLLTIIKTGRASYEEVMRNAHEYKDQLTAFNDLKKRNRLPADKKDILRIKTLQELMDMMMNLGGGNSEEGQGHSDFKQDIHNIREGITKITGLEDRYIPENIQKTDDVFEYLGENDKWEIWGAKNEFATMIFDRWGNGAGWCVGGMLGNNKGLEQLRQAQNYFPHYNGGGATYVCFQQKDKNAARPTNKYLITLGPNGSLPETSAGYQFNDANNRTQYPADYDYHDSQSAQMDAFADFLKREGLTEIFKKTRFKDCEAFLNIENKERLEKSEPYRYVGGKIRAFFRDSIDIIEFEGSDGKTHQVSAKEHPEYLNAETLNDMENMENLILGKPFIFDGTPIKQIFKPLIKEVVLPDSYNFEIRWDNVDKLCGINHGAFKGCEHLEKVTFPEQVVALGRACFNVNGFNGDYTDVQLYTPRHKLKIVQTDVEFIKSHLNWLE